MRFRPGGQRPAAERARLVRRVGEIMEQRVYEIAAALALEVGKNRMEALGEAQETVDFFNHYADDFESHGGFDHELPNDPLASAVSRNRSVMRPYGVWVVIAPFNFPLALAGGPAAAALVTGNTVVVKGASDTPWAGRLLADCVRDAGLPPGVFNYLSGSGREVGEALVAHPATAGLTFTGSAAVGMSLLARMAGGAYPRPCIAEMGGKNPCIVTARADLDRAAQGIVRSAYGMGGQKCSALSRVYVHDDVADALLERLERRVGEIRIGDPAASRELARPGRQRVRVCELRQVRRRTARTGGARIISGGRQLRDGALARGYYVEPVLAEAPLSHRLWKHEMFLPILMVHRVRDREEAMRLANDSDLGLTAGFYGGADEVPWFHEHIEAGVTYANRPQGATTGAWPGLPAVRRLEGLRLDRQGDRLVLLPGPVPARAVAHRRGVSACSFSRSARRLRSTCATATASALEGFTHLIPFAAGHEIIRQRRRNLHLVRMTPDLVYDQMIGMGCASRLTFSWGGNPGVGSLHRLRDAVEHGWPQPLAIDEHTHAGMAAAYCAGAARLPFGVLRGYIGTDLVGGQPARSAASSARSPASASRPCPRSIRTSRSCTRSARIGRATSRSWASSAPSGRLRSPRARWS